MTFSFALKNHLISCPSLLSPILLLLVCFHIPLDSVFHMTEEKLKSWVKTRNTNHTNFKVVGQDGMNEHVTNGGTYFHRTSIFLWLALNSQQLFCFHFLNVEVTCLSHDTQTNYSFVIDNILPSQPMKPYHE